MLGVIADRPAVDPQIAASQQSKDAERGVMDVPAALADIAERAHAGTDRVGDSARDAERRRERGGAQERPLLASIGEQAHRRVATR